MSDLITFIGGGNMATSMIGGLIAAGHPGERIRVVDAKQEQIDALRARFGTGGSLDMARECADADVVVVAVKPQQVPAALAGLELRSGATVVSIAAGIRINTLSRLLGSQVHYVRCMPNTPALVGSGVSGLFTESATPDGARASAQRLLAAAGKVVWVDTETDLDAVTAVSGSGPAYFFLLTELMRDAGVQLGLTPEAAGELARHTLIGAARMVEATGTEPATLRQQVTSKGGTTAAALGSMENSGIASIVAKALQAAATRSRELGDEFDAQA